MKRLIAMAIIAVTAIEFVSAAPEVTDIAAKQRYPWNGLVDITCRVAGIEADAGGYEFSMVAVNKETGREYAVSTFSIQHNGEDVPDVCGNGDYSLLWNAREDIGQVVIERMTVRIALEALAVSVGKVQLWEGGPYWADRNIGAKKPEDSGLYFWWGDTTGHRPGYNFDEDNSAIYTYRKGVAELRGAGWITNSNILVPHHDAAHVKWGGAWRMPNKAEWDDIIRKCDWTWTTMSGVRGFIVRGKGSYASNSIFIPAAGTCAGTLLYKNGLRGYYWSSVLYITSVGEDSLRAWYLYFESDYPFTHGMAERCDGCPIRPIQVFTN